MAGKKNRPSVLGLSGTKTGARITSDEAWAAGKRAQDKVRREQRAKGLNPDKVGQYSAQSNAARKAALSKQKEIDTLKRIKPVGKIKKKKKNGMK